MNDQRPAWVVTGPTSGIGYRTALELAAYGTVVLVGRNADKLAAVQRQIEDGGGVATPVVAEFADAFSARQAASQVAALDLSVRGVLNNAGIMLSKPATSPQGWELTFATNHLGPLAFTDALVPALADGTNVVFIASAVEDPERKPAVRAGFRGSRYISAEAAARGEYRPGGSSHPGMDAYATSKRQPRDRFQPGTTASASALSRDRARREPGIESGQ